MIALLALLAASPMVQDPADALNATQRAELEVASDGRVVVAFTAGGDARELNEQADALARAHPGRAVVLFDRALDVGTLRLPRPSAEPRARAFFESEVARLSTPGTPAYARVLRAVDFAGRVTWSAPAKPPEPMPSNCRATFHDVATNLQFFTVAFFFLVLWLLGAVTHDRGKRLRYVDVRDFFNWLRDRL